MKKIVRRTGQVALAAIALSAAPLPAHANKCGYAPSYWNVPRGALVVARTDSGPITKVMDAIGEHFTHSMFSHGPNEASHATRNASYRENGDCGTPIDGSSLKFGWPGAERVSVSGLWQYLFGDSDPAKRANEVAYLESVSWDPHTRYVPAECKNPRVQGDGSVLCDAFAGCANARVPVSDWNHVHCSANPGCSNDPVVIGDVITCDQAVSGCATNGHIWRPNMEYSCQPVTTSQYCSNYIPMRCLDGAKIVPGTIEDEEQVAAFYRLHHCSPPRCTRYDTSTYDPEPDTRRYAEANRLPAVLVRYGEGYGVGVRRVTPDGAAIASYLEGLPVTSTSSDQSSQYAPFGRYGYFYDFSQYTNLRSTAVGGVDAGTGMVCSTFLAWAQFNATHKVVTPHDYLPNLVGAAARGVYNFGFDLCDSNVGGWDRTGYEMLCWRQLCRDVGRQIVNCFAYGNCETSDDDMANAAMNNQIGAHSISPDRLAGWNQHRPVWKGGGPSQEPITSVWAADDTHPAVFSGSSVYGCWE